MIGLIILSGIISFILLTIMFTKWLDWVPYVIGMIEKRKK